MLETLDLRMDQALLLRVLLLLLLGELEPRREDEPGLSSKSIDRADVTLSLRDLT
jgi:hypothetical protein